MGLAGVGPSLWACELHLFQASAESKSTDPSAQRSELVIIDDDLYLLVSTISSETALFFLALSFYSQNCACLS